MGNCKFYNCVDSMVPCGDDGYAIGYGYRYCSRFTEHYDKFTDDVSMLQGSGVREFKLLANIIKSMVTTRNITIRH